MDERTFLGTTTSGWATILSIGAVLPALYLAVKHWTKGKDHMLDKIETPLPEMNPDVPWQDQAAGRDRMARALWFRSRAGVLIDDAIKQIDLALADLEKADEAMKLPDAAPAVREAKALAVKAKEGI